ncbi:MAG: protein tyrosine phosphatase family protein [Geminicoccaceae bacterium]|jgi:uncharacterized protein (TIGR01244 family)|nr:protein tyrosine phosphatase family protein [Geminicoccaceae bacterium]
MDEVIRLNEDYAVASSEPARRTFDRIAAEGFRSVVSFQTREEEQKLPIEDEREAAAQAGLAFLHQPVSGDSLDDETVDRFRDALGGLPKPVLLHCSSGKRAGAMTMMHLASEMGLSGDEALEKAASMGFECDNPKLEAFVRDYVDRHQRRSSATPSAAATADRR